ncbi:hypothetical protein C1Y11_16920 [Pseudomonas sp. FW305-20]|nr:hypothetical protein C1Y11_16920 [Pseudomonas sp. FW305-20]PMU18623.1 hypothetical protein C1Y10_12085 [Pseudomonas sp. FW305-122]PMU40987.1 hypothetical protein C1Y12_09540 [Pseudomonas sp. FW305-47B]PMX61390.1 hypothetical protein C1Y13_12400 [Pseudomonas sp. FW305-33]PMX69025.1 hypothetical protein C1X12_09655 [Pseudomonas sp. FW305-60]
MGASLLAIADRQSTSSLNVSPPSRAGSLPHWFGGDHKKPALPVMAARAFSFLAFRRSRE